MARPTLFTHQKFLRLAYLLGLPEPYTLGLLEFMWHAAYQSGNPMLGDELGVELVCKWPGERGVLCARLLEAGFIDRDADGRYLIHDLWDHAPDYVRKRMQREGDRRHRYAPRSRPLTAEWRPAAPNSELGSLIPPNSELGCPPAPAPTPTPSTPPTPLRGGDSPPTKKKRRPCIEGDPEGFVEFWEAYPRKEARQAAARAFARLSPDAALRAVLLAAVVKQQKGGCLESRRAGDGRSVVPHGATWINQKRWEDQPPAEANGHADRGLEDLFGKLLGEKGIK